MGHYKTGSDKQDWATPQPLFDKLNKEFSFTLDACATNKTAKCTVYFDEEEDALKQTWAGRVFMNPPYGREIERWVCKASEQRQNCEVIVGLIPVRSDAKWWHRYVLGVAHEIRFTLGRVGYLDPANGLRGRANITFGSAVVVWKSTIRYSPWVSTYELPKGSGRKA